MQTYQLTWDAPHADGEFMDVRGYRDRIYAISRKNGGSLTVFDADLCRITSLEGIGSARQIEIRDGLAFITAREDGLFIVDLTADEPRIVSHYRTVEFATGITLYKGYARDSSTRIRIGATTASTRSAIGSKMAFWAFVPETDVRSCRTEESSFFGNRATSSSIPRQRSMISQSTAQSPRSEESFFSTAIFSTRPSAHTAPSR